MANWTETNAIRDDLGYRAKWVRSDDSFEVVKHNGGFSIFVRQPREGDGRTWYETYPAAGTGYYRSLEAAQRAADKRFPVAA